MKDSTGLNGSGLEHEWIAACSSTDVPKGFVYRTRLLGVDIILWRNRDGIHAFLDRCPHRGAALSLGSIIDEKLVCPYHGWQFDGNGKCILIPSAPRSKVPARAATELFHTDERHGLVWIKPASTKARVPIPEFNAINCEHNTQTNCGPYLVRAYGTRIIENFVDIGHLPFVHGKRLGDPLHSEVKPYRILTEPGAITLKGIPIYQPNPDGSGVSQVVNYSYKVTSPLSASFSKSFEQETFSIIMTITPRGPLDSLVWLIVSHSLSIPRDVVRSFQQEIMNQDTRILESISPSKVPLSCRSEVHTRADVMPDAYRHLLAELRVTYGTDYEHEF